MRRYAYSIVILLVGVQCHERPPNEDTGINVIDLSQPTTWKVLSDYYGALQKNWKICINCGIPGMGTAMHLEHSATNPAGAMYPAVIPTEYLLTKLAVIDVSSLVKLNPTTVLTLDVALQWLVLKHDPREPTLLVFKFGWKEESVSKQRSCVCKIPGISYELAEWIAANMTHVVGVATDTPTLESEETREMTSRTVANLLGRNGIYMIENVNMQRTIPERGCMALAMPLMLQHMNYVPTRLTALCPAHSTKHVVLSLKTIRENDRVLPSRGNANVEIDVNLEEIMS